VTAAAYQPSREEFAALCHDHAVVPVWREVLADLSTPLGVYDRLRHAGGPRFLLESVERGERWGRYSFIGLRPFLELRARAGCVELIGDAPAAARDAAATGDPLATLDVLLPALRTPELPGLPPLFAGAVGYIGYDAVRFIERLPDSGVDDLGMDDVRLAFPGQLVAFDHLRQRLLVVTNVRAGREPGAAYDAAVAASEELVAGLGTSAHAPPVPPPRAAEVTDARANMSRDDYLEAVERAKAHIAAGDAFQIVPSQRFSLETAADPFTVYRVLRVINPSPYMYLFELPEPDGRTTAIVGSSPEALVTVKDGRAEIWPIAGSRPRGATDEQDAKLEADLRGDDKERAEHVMLVDLARNDLGRVSRLGTVRVTDFMDVVRYSHIMHLLSKVTGRLRPGVSGVDVLRATFPAGTLSGAPKVRAMEIIDELEPTRRGLYGGGIGYLDLAGDLDLCIAIRTLLFRGGFAHVQAGAGVVADSVAEREYAETRDKAMALLAAVRAAERLGEER
jgi:anthranilate synthase component 1